jgi:hypothetical protein
MRVLVKSLTGQVLEIHGLSEDSSVAELHEEIHQQLGIPPSVHRLIYSGKELLDKNESLRACGILESNITDAYVHLVIRTTSTSPAAAAAEDNAYDPFPPTPTTTSVEEESLILPESLRNYARTLLALSMCGLLQVIILSLNQSIYYLPLASIPLLSLRTLRSLQHLYLLLPNALLQVSLAVLLCITAVHRSSPHTWISAVISTALAIATAWNTRQFTSIVRHASDSLRQRTAAIL